MISAIKTLSKTTFFQLNGAVMSKPC